MSALSPLSGLAHLRYKAADRFGFAPDLVWIPINDTEYHLMAHHLPLVVRYLGGQPRLGTLLHASYLWRSVVDDEGRWRAGYLPLTLRTHPFILSPREAARPIDELDVAGGSGLIGLAGVAICSDPAAGVLGPEVQAIRNTLHMMRNGTARLTRALELLAISDVLVPLREPGQAESVYLTVDPGRLSGLHARALAACARESFLPIDLACSILFSRRHVHADRLPLEERRTTQSESAAPRGDPMDFVLANLELMDFVLDASELFELDDFSDHGGAFDGASRAGAAEPTNRS